MPTINLGRVVGEVDENTPIVFEDYEVITPPESDTALASIRSNTSISSLFSNIKGFLKNVVTKNKIANNFTTNTEGYVADARTVKTLKNEVDILTNDLNGYIMSAFTNNVECLTLCWSNDAVNWRTIGFPFMETGTNIIRDPSIIKIDDTYYVAYTSSWADSKFGIAKTKDFIQWDKFYIDLSTTGGRVWGPEFFTDDDGSIHITISISSTISVDDFHAYELHATSEDLSTWSTPVQIQGNMPTNILDASIIKDGGYYYLFYKNDNTKYVEYARSTNLTSGFVVKGSGNWAGFGQYLEGAQVVKKYDGTFIIYLDSYEDGKYYYATTDNLEGTWSQKQSLGMDIDLRHFYVIKSNDYIIDMLKCASSLAYNSITNRYYDTIFYNRDYDLNDYTNAGRTCMFNLKAKISNLPVTLSEDDDWSDANVEFLLDVDNNGKNWGRQKIESFRSSHTYQRRFFTTGVDNTITYTEWTRLY